VSSKVHTTTIGESTPAKQGAKPRIVALTALATLALGTAFVARGAYFAATDAWMAPITLSPDSDAVLAINVKLTEQQVAREKMRADIERIDADVKGIDAAVAKLESIQTNGEAALRWSVFTTTAQSASNNERMQGLIDQKRLLDSMFARQETATATAKKNAAAGLVTKQDVEREEQLLDQLQLGKVQNMREMQDSRAQSAQLFAMHNQLKQASTSPSQNGLLPEIATGQERAVHMSLELIKLSSEKRSLLSQRGIAVETMSRMDDMLKQLQARPLYRAVQAQTDVAFVPYSQLDDMKVGAKLMSCKYVMFKCEVVGKVSEILPGEVAAQDPWNNLARGQYVILQLNDRDAAKEKVLRARK